MKFKIVINAACNYDDIDELSIETKLMFLFRDINIDTSIDINVDGIYFEFEETGNELS